MQKMFPKCPEAIPCHRKQKVVDIRDNWEQWQEYRHSEEVDDHDGDEEFSEEASEDSFQDLPLLRC